MAVVFISIAKERAKPLPTTKNSTSVTYVAGNLRWSYIGRGSWGNRDSQLHCKDKDKFLHFKSLQFGPWVISIGMRKVLPKMVRGWLKAVMYNSRTVLRKDLW